MAVQLRVSAAFNLKKFLLHVYYKDIYLSVFHADVQSNPDITTLVYTIPRLLRQIFCDTN